MSRSTEQPMEGMDRGRKLQFGADCEKQRRECNNPKTGAQIETLITHAYANPKISASGNRHLSTRTQRGKQIGRMDTARAEES
jgi:hypothetical protein